MSRIGNYVLDLQTAQDQAEASRMDSARLKAQAESLAAALAGLREAMKTVAPLYLAAMDNYNGWVAKAAVDAHPGKGFCLEQADIWLLRAMGALNEVAALAAFRGRS